MAEKHGMSLTREYRTWAAMKRRCYNPNVNAYPRYGGRGITVCEQWRESFTNFLLDIGASPFAGAEIERIDNDGNYEPGNVRWATRKEQMRNTNATRWITFRGETLTLLDWAERIGMPHARLRARIDKLNMPLDVALTPGRRSIKGLRKQASSWMPHQQRVWGLQ